MIGLGRMGANMAARLVQGGHRVVGYDPHAESVQGVRERGGVGADSLAALTGQLAPPRVVWLMVPSGKQVDETIDRLCGRVRTHAGQTGVSS